MLTRTPSVRFTMFTSFAIAVFAVAAWRYCAASQIPEPKTEPKIIDPGDATRAPSDAVVLFDGKDLSNWVSANGEGPAKWEVKDGAMVVVPRSGPIRTKRAFDDVQLHIEWATPAEVVGEGQGRGNSGVFLQGLYEVQVLDSYNNKTYFHGQAGSIYKQYPPLVNACRKPGEWQSYDIIYHAPIFGDDGRVKKKATITALQNGVLIQDHSEVFGTTTNEPVFPTYTKHGKGPIILQDHGNPMRFRNVWVREL
jgi:3-keto-disaccharide hydrolase